jgi:hypothetical protein
MLKPNWVFSALPIAMGAAVATACAASPRTPAAAANAPARADATPPPAPSAAPVEATAALAPSDAYDDPGELHDPATLVPLIAEGEHPTFPRETIDEHTCWQTLALSGNARRDFDALVQRCGTPTGSIEYAKPVAGRLHHRLDKRDTYVIPIRRGLCYRFFGVGDDSIHDLDILIERQGALQGEDRSNGPVAIIDADKSWCMNVSGEYEFHVQVKSEGQGEYVFGVWARPGAPD